MGAVAGNPSQRGLAAFSLFSPTKDWAKTRGDARRRHLDVPITGVLAPSRQRRRSIAAATPVVEIDLLLRLVPWD
jgi:hypothetical protein